VRPRPIFTNKLHIPNSDQYITLNYNMRGVITERTQPPPILDYTTEVNEAGQVVKQAPQIRTGAAAPATQPPREPVPQLLRLGAF
jgi:hypothetical protein